ncbi:MAG TPA: PGF-pre-PGF domain-containing protein [Methanocorpusculum sp.]|nr:PGF-pre-PGF domain-containing protein [Methanocorpusculum sp.]HJK79623.1 PGF-pre-PGF domain-containing protein [Methanocorpusculum sp.]
MILQTDSTNPAADTELRPGPSAQRSRAGRRLALLLLACVLMTGAVSAAPTGNWTDAGNYDTTWTKGAAGTAGDPYQITTAAQLAGVAVMVNNHTTCSKYEGKYFKLTNTTPGAYDLGSHFWTPIGNTTKSDLQPWEAGMFNGTFDGGGHLISNMNVTVSLSDERAYTGLFGYVWPATIRNVDLEGGAVTASTTHKNAGTGYAHAYSGGLTGFVRQSTITNCSATGAISAACINSKPSTGSGAYAGGLVGLVTMTTITNCYAAGAVTGKNEGTCSSFGAHAGGLVGYAWKSPTTITNCYATGAVTAISNVPLNNYDYTAYAGGLLGGSYTASISITNCYATGVVTATSSGDNAPWAGGLAGGNSDTKGISITSSAALNPRVNVDKSGDTGSKTPDIRRLIAAYKSGSITSCYAWRHMELNDRGTITKPVSDPDGKNAANASTAMIWNNQSFYEDLGWDFTNNWTMSTDPQYRLPVLAWQSGAVPAGADARHLNKTHDIQIDITGNGGTITPTPERSDGAAIVFTITGTPDTFTDNGADKKSEISGTTYTLDDFAEDHIIAAVFPRVPEVQTAVITAHNTTAANVTFTLNSSCSGAEEVWVNLTGSSYSRSIQTGPVSAGGTAATQFTGLTPGQSYRLNITPLNTSIPGGIPVISSYTYTAPSVPPIPPVPPVPPVPPQPSGASGDGYSSTSSGFISETGQAAFGTGTGITCISFAKGTTGIVILDSDPTGITPPPDSYAVYDITGPAFEGYAQIEFSVPLALLTDNGYTVNDVILQHFTGGTWVRLDTTYLGEEHGAANYIAATRSFSPFAITYEKDGAAAIEKATPEPTAAAQSSTPTRSPVPTPAGDQSGTPAAATAAPAGETPVPALTQAPAPVAGLLSGLIAAGILLRRRE